MKITSCVCVLLLLVNVIVKSQTDNIDYLGQVPPDSVPMPFSPSTFLPDGFMNHGVPVISPDGNSIYFGLIRLSDELHVIMYIKKKPDNTWTKPTIAPFSGVYNDDYPSFSPNGQKLYYCSDRKTGIPGRTNWWFDKHDIWYVEKKDTMWDEPSMPGIPLIVDKIDINPSVSTNGNIYYTGEGNFSSDYFGLWFAEKVNDNNYLSPKLITSTINSSARDWTPYIAPDEDYFIFSSSRNDINNYADDLYVSFKVSSGEWTKPRNMGSLINSGTQEKYPWVSPDGKYLFFVRSWAETDTIYWVSSNIIQKLKNIEFSTVVKQIENNELKIYPNPTTGQIKLSIETTKNHEVLVEVYNLQGAQVFSKTFQNTPSATIDLTGNSAGMYVVKVIADGVSYEEKIVKE